jgi:hypothetical protein
MPLQIMPIAQSAMVAQPTHLPWPSHTLPPLSVHTVCAAADVVTQHPAVQLEMRHTVESAGQSLVLAHFSNAGQPASGPPDDVEAAVLVVVEALVLLVVVGKPPRPPSRMGWTTLEPLQDAAPPIANEKSSQGSTERNRREGMRGRVSSVFVATAPCQFTPSKRRP